LRHQSRPYNALPESHLYNIPQEEVYDDLDEMQMTRDTAIGINSNGEEHYNTIGLSRTADSDYYLHPQSADYEEPSTQISNGYISGNKIKSISASVDDYESPVSAVQDSEDYLRPI